MKGSSFYMISTSLVTLPMHASALFIIQITTSIHHTSMDIEFKTCAMQANICKCTYKYKYNIQVYELAPLTCVLQILIDPLTMSFHLFAPPILLSL